MNSSTVDAMLADASGATWRQMSRMIAMIVIHTRVGIVWSRAVRSEKDACDAERNNKVVTSVRMCDEPCVHEYEVERGDKATTSIRSQGERGDKARSRVRTWDESGNTKIRSSNIAHLARRRVRLFLESFEHHHHHVDIRATCAANDVLVQPVWLHPDVRVSAR